MHYAKTTFSKNGYDITIRPIPGLYGKEIGQRVRLSPLDILQANRLYECPSKLIICILYCGQPRILFSIIRDIECLKGRVVGAINMES